MKFFLALCFIAALVITTVDGQDNDDCNYFQKKCNTGEYCAQAWRGSFGLCLPYIQLGGCCSDVLSVQLRCAPGYECRAVNRRYRWYKTCQYPPTTASPPTTTGTTGPLQ